MTDKPKTAQEAANEVPREVRWSAKRKIDAVLRLLKGHSLDALSREYNVPAGRLSAWRDEFLAAGEAGLKSRPPSADVVSDTEVRDMRAKIGEITMENELLRAKIGRMEAGLPPARRRWKP